MDNMDTQIQTLMYITSKQESFTEDDLIKFEVIISDN